MPRIPSPNQDIEGTSFPTHAPTYPHPATRRSGVIPMVFQVTSPFDRRLALLPHSLVLHVNPNSFEESHTKKKEVIQTRGGWVEQHWPDEMSEISCSGSTGAFVNLYTGVSSIDRQDTIAWDRYRDLYDLFNNNGSVYDPYGNIVLQGSIMMMYDRGTYLGFFTTFSVEETDASPYTFNLSWTFKVEETLMSIPAFTGPYPRIPAFVPSVPTIQSNPQASTAQTTSQVPVLTAVEAGNLRAQRGSE